MLWESQSLVGAFEAGLFLSLMYFSTRNWSRENDALRSDLLYVSDRVYQGHCVRATKRKTSSSSTSACHSKITSWEKKWTTVARKQNAILWKEKESIRAGTPLIKLQRVSITSLLTHTICSSLGRSLEDVKQSTRFYIQRKREQSFTFSTRSIRRSEW